MSGEVIEGEIVKAVAVREPSDAMEVFGQVGVGIQRAQIIAKQLDDIVRQRGLAVRIGQGEHLKIEGWLTLAAMCGLTPNTDWVKGDENGFHARVSVVRISTGIQVGAAEARCDFSEKAGNRTRWPREEPARAMSMAQTRATSKAIAQCLRWITILAGYSGTPLEEMPVGGEGSAGRGGQRGAGSSPEGGTVGAGSTPRPAKPVTKPGCISAAQGKRLWAIFNSRVDQVEPDLNSDDRRETLHAIVKEIAGVESSTDIPWKSYDRVVDAAERWGASKLRETQAAIDSQPDGEPF